MKWTSRKTFYVAGFPLRQCLFVEGQLAGFTNDNPVAILESEKTVILMAETMPDYTSLAT